MIGNVKNIADFAIGKTLKIETDFLLLMRCVFRVRNVPSSNRKDIAASFSNNISIITFLGGIDMDEGSFLQFSNIPFNLNRYPISLHAFFEFEGGILYHF
jgi:hypothetical protein